METDYKVKLEVFEGPLDLLLYLIKQDEIDIYDISLERITSQYLEYLQAFKELNIELAGEFIVRFIAFRKRSTQFCNGLQLVLPFVSLICSARSYHASKWL